ncbi:MKI67 FHA domain-interacting nucleolar phosphoprotein-like [Mercenaria mercenaria]|uniref:MKI67 FHA domain-interacting nucleolar phosphoprotein-like n=1 Tax=Mercenaria mercenaria TaxID=6596 RepID=UPI00234F716A|nr:MKI67 FHA domain-interacting nucleolar phosphoprotein-like [Mercenaria mercenaria]
MAKSRKRGASSNIALDASRQKKFNQAVHRIKQNVTEGQSDSSVVYVSHLPWGFEEKPLREYFEQFGKIKQLRVSRSKKTGNSRGFAYIQFTHNEVAKIVAETMNNYLMFGKLIKCKHLLKPHPNTFKHANRGFIKPGAVAGAIAKHNSEKSDSAVEKSQRKMLGKLAKIQAKLAAEGIQYKVEDSHLNEVKKELKEKAEAKKMLREQNDKKKQAKTGKKQTAKVKSDDEGDDDSDSDSENDDSEDDDSDDDSDSDDTEATETQGTKENKNIGQKTPKHLTSKSLKSGQAENRSTKKRQSLIPNEVDTPKGKMNVLIEDSSEDEISFKTPPRSIKSSKLDDTLKSMKATPVSTEKRSPKRKLNEKTPMSKGTVTPKPEVLEKKRKLTPKSAQKTNTPKVVHSKKQEMVTPKSECKSSDRSQSGKKTPAKKTLPSESKKKQLKK